MRRLLMAAVLLLTPGCYDQEPNRGATVNGAYTLRTVNAAPLPFTSSGSGANKTELLDDSYTLYEGLTYAELGHVRTTVNGTATTTAFSGAGSYSLFGASVTLRPASGGSERIATYTDNTLTLTESGKLSVYRK